MFSRDLVATASGLLAARIDGAATDWIDGKGRSVMAEARQGERVSVWSGSTPAR
jgi:hypothetical protein